MIIEGNNSLLQRTLDGTVGPLLSATSFNQITIKNLTIDSQGTLQTRWEPNPYVNAGNEDNLLFINDTDNTVY